MGKIRERRADSTADTYASCLRNQVLPQLGELRLSECDRPPRRVLLAPGAGSAPTENDGVEAPQDKDGSQLPL